MANEQRIMKVAPNSNSTRHYLFNKDGKKVKMIPAEYKEIAHLLKVQDYDTRRLTVNERLQLEIMSFKRLLEIKERYVYELINKRAFRSIRLVHVKFGDDRLEASFDGLHIVCSKKMFNLARRALYPFSEIKSMS